ncbi:MAG: sigma-54 dependent transcriptional regulator [Burkholderiaceae bacterium]|nr:sigma-54 dependent transcriptional regulator [Burkholderiaceae bacterium]
MPHVLIVDADAQSSGALRTLLADESCTCAVVATLRQAATQLALQQPDWILAAHDLPDGSGLDLLEAVDGDEAPALALMADRPTAEQAIDAFRRGALDYLIRPIDARRLRQLLASRKPRSRSDAPRSAAAPQLLGASPVMQTLRDHIDRVAPTEASVLLLGESGTGKELVAQNIHARSPRHRQPFLPVNCGAISPQLIESEIFGHERGSFTGADRQHKGYFERASGGTLFLDEVIEMPIELQVKLLRVLETGAFMRIGSNQELGTDVRIIAATNRDPEAAIAEGRLRLDLYHRLNVFPLRIPALRERGHDIDILARHFLDEFNAAHGTAKQIPPSALVALCNYHWPGNVRELRNFMQRAYILSDQVLDTPTLEAGPARCSAMALTLAIPVGTSLADVDRKLIFATLELCGGVKKRAADLLGISLKTLYNRLEEYGNDDRAAAIAARHQGVPASIVVPGYESGLLN